LLGLVSSDPFNQNITFSSDLSCGQCIIGNYNFCFKGKYGERSASGEKTPGKEKSPKKWEAVCCKDRTCK